MGALSRSRPRELLYGSASFADAEAREQRVEDVLHADAAGDAAERAQREAQVLGAQFRQVGGLSAGEARSRLLQRGAMAGLGQRRRAGAFGQRRAASVEPDARAGCPGLRRSAR